VCERERGGGQEREREGGRALARSINGLMCFSLDSSEAVLILCRVKPSRLPLGDGFTSMPLLLSQGPLRLTEPALKWLGASFDCLISPSLLKQEDLLLLAGHYANTGTTNLKLLKTFCEFYEWECFWRFYFWPISHILLVWKAC
jgi:hypothetical protein